MHHEESSLFYVLISDAVLGLIIRHDSARGRSISLENSHQSDRNKNPAKLIFL